MTKHSKPGFVSALQVAERAGVSRSAVSRTFTPGASVSAETRRKVLRAAEELGYEVNDLARGLLANQSRLVGLVVTNPEEGFRAFLVAALARALIARGSVPVLINTGRTPEDLLAAQKVLLRHRAEATVILSGTPPTEFAQLARRNGQPLVVIGRSEPDADHVRAGNSEASRRIARLLVESGRTVLGMVGSRSGTPSVVEREASFTEEAERLGATVITARGCDSVYEGGREAARTLLRSQRRPEAVFCVNDPMAFGVLDVLRHEAGLRVPEDVAVVGFDNVPEAGWASFDLTTFWQDPEAIAAAAVSLIEARQHDPQRPLQRLRVVPELVIRGSFVPRGAPR
ncbi:LacI family DNA-binding transcriptional regulator [Polymorphum gilvum]|uniref:Transcriptional regulator, LacI family protein n=1 Tax=Polymorphum gilvum (strain LMG 25793 / CGMCC 1.9160 / SL003B-26A1) TaxID=991905 RepID=F2IXJ0_POLGS|nr:LacI family DNA-binding transcriptional regulator [Polymorphum gilvum]ADZ71613.1 transcriptional regulator, LacI family protein [Polymorphum gilvum SL003B-26A1]